MNGETFDTRLARLEQRVTDIDAHGSRGVARVDARVIQNTQRLADMDARINTIVPMTSTVIVLSEQVRALREDIQEMRVDWSAEKQQQHDDRRHWKALAYTVAGMLLCAFIGAATVIVNGALH